MEIELKNLGNGSYNLKNSLYFTGSINIQNNLDNKLNKLNFLKIIIDKQSALEIMYTLLDSMNRLDSDLEELICDMKDDINVSS